MAICQCERVSAQGAIPQGNRDAWRQRKLSVPAELVGAGRDFGLGEFPHFFLNTQTVCRIWKPAEAFRSTYFDPARGWSTAADLPDVSNAFAPPSTMPATTCYFAWGCFPYF
jgi:hypothetical protein